jgi:two-component system sensor histidine kinase DesK
LLALKDEMRRNGSGSFEPTSEMSGHGHGLLGLRDEITALGGSLDAGPGRRGWLVCASLPLRGAGE